MRRGARSPPLCRLQVERRATELHNQGQTFEHKELCQKIERWRAAEQLQLPELRKMKYQSAVPLVNTLFQEGADCSGLPAPHAAYHEYVR